MARRIVAEFISPGNGRPFSFVSSPQLTGGVKTASWAFSFPAFHWIAFAVMVAGVVSFALQLTIGKLVVLAKAAFSPAEILSDALGLTVSLVGLVLTTQAAAENSSFTGSSAAVLSATAVGVIAGFVFYLWGQRQELQALEGRKRSGSANSDRTKS